MTGVQTCALPILAETIGIKVNQLTPAHVKEIWPLCETDGLIGAIQHPDDGYIQPADLTQALAKAGGQMSVVLRGNAVNYAVAAQNPKGVTIGKLEIENPVAPTREIARMKSAGIPVYLIREDLERRGIAASAVVGDVEMVSQGQLAGLCGKFEQVWHC